jgi:hypothetical protein
MRGVSRAPHRGSPLRSAPAPSGLDLRVAYPASEPPVAEPVAAPRPSRVDSELRAWMSTSILLVAIWAMTGAGYFWPVWPILGWGVFVVGPVLPSPLRGTLPTCRRNASSRLSTNR